MNDDNHQRIESELNCLMMGCSITQWSLLNIQILYFFIRDVMMHIAI